MTQHRVGMKLDAWVIYSEAIRDHTLRLMLTKRYISGISKVYLSVTIFHITTSEHLGDLSNISNMSIKTHQACIKLRIVLTKSVT